jgi:hypothetical protein
VKASRRFTIALALSIAAHVAFFVVPMRKPIDQTILGSAAPTPMTVTITESQPPAEPAQAAVEAAPAPLPIPKPVPQRRPAPLTPPPVAAEAPKTFEPLAPPAPPEPRSPPLMDMAAMLEARRAQRRAAEAEAARGSGSGREPSADELAMATINRNLHVASGEGVGGVFQILRKGTRTAEFAFNGWRPDTDRRWREVIEVDAGQGGDVERAIVKRMIELIRGHYSGDFRWESRYLGRVVVLSASPENNAGLEDFLIREFFGTPALR